MGSSGLPSDVGHPLQDNIFILCIQLLLIFSLDSVHILRGHQLQTVCSCSLFTASHLQLIVIHCLDN